MYRIEFYEQSAQLLPLLYLTLIIEYRALKPNPHIEVRVRRVRTLLLYVVSLSFAIAEFSCLHVLAFGKLAGPSGNGSIMLAYVIAFAAFVMPFTEKLMDEQQSFSKGWHGWAFNGLALAIWMGLTLIAVTLWG